MTSNTPTTLEIKFILSRFLLEMGWEWCLCITCTLDMSSTWGLVVWHPADYIWSRAQRVQNISKTACFADSQPAFGSTTERQSNDFSFFFYYLGSHNSWIDTTKTLEEKKHEEFMRNGRRRWHNVLLTRGDSTIKNVNQIIGYSRSCLKHQNVNRLQLS